MENTNRHLELSSKLIQMGNALIKEGDENNDYSVGQMGSFFILMGSLFFDERDIYEFGLLCSMFSAKKIVESLEANGSDVITKIKEDSKKESYEDLIKRINKLREDNGHSPIGE